MSFFDAIAHIQPVARGNPTGLVQELRGYAAIQFYAGVLYAIYHRTPYIFVGGGGLSGGMALYRNTTGPAIETILIPSRSVRDSVTLFFEKDSLLKSLFDPSFDCSVRGKLRLNDLPQPYTWSDLEKIYHDSENLFVDTVPSTEYEAMELLEKIDTEFLRQLKSFAQEKGVSR